MNYVESENTPVETKAGLMSNINKTGANDLSTDQNVHETSMLQNLMDLFSQIDV